MGGEREGQVAVRKWMDCTECEAAQRRIEVNA
jgi:hypothetical protein